MEGRDIATDELVTRPAEGDEQDRRPTVVLVDDEPDVLFLLERLLTKQGFEVVGSARDGEQGISCVGDHQPDVVLLDLAMPTLDGEAALPRLVLEAQQTMVVVLSSHVDPRRSRELLSRGAFAVYDKQDFEGVLSALPDDLDRFRRALDGEDTVPVLRARRAEG